MVSQLIGVTEQLRLPGDWNPWAILVPILQKSPSGYGPLIDCYPAGPGLPTGLLSFHHIAS